MKRLVVLLCLVAACAALTGCNECNTRRNGCDTCGAGLGGRLGQGRCRGCGVGGLLSGGLCSNCSRGRNHNSAEQMGGGPPMAQYAYPYYTVRGPRDFLVNNPPPIGP